MALDFGITGPTIFGNGGVLKRCFHLGEGLAFVEGVDSLTHPETRLDVLAVVVEDSLALVHNLVVLIQIQAAHREVATARHLGILSCLTLQQVFI